MTDLSIQQVLGQSEGRNCPLGYRYTPADIAAVPARTVEVLYVVGGLYGNPFALEALQRLASLEQTPVEMVFNGDFNWFNSTAEDFRYINSQVLRYRALRGNVETELSAATPGAGCGCAYPRWVDEATVQRSNRIMAQLTATAADHSDLTARLQALPMFSRVQVGDLRVALVHGDAHSLAGWGFSRESLMASDAVDRLRGDFEQAQVEVFASSHTCTPVLRRLSLGAGAGDAVLINNGAAGMPNPGDSRNGIITRIAAQPGPAAPLYAEQLDGVRIEALALEYDHGAFRGWFLDNWPPGSPAHQSYYQRISDPGGRGESG